MRLRGGLLSIYIYIYIYIYISTSICLIVYIHKISLAFLKSESDTFSEVVCFPSDIPATCNHDAARGQVKRASSRIFHSECSVSYTDGALS